MSDISYQPSLLWNKQYEENYCQVQSSRTTCNAKDFYQMHSTLESWNFGRDSATATN